MPGMKRFSKLLKGGTGSSPNSEEDTPEAAAARGVRRFCESASPTSAGEEVLHLPVIVEAAESSPAAAASAALQIRKFLSRDNFVRPHMQYNAIMLIRILADNPGQSFTRNIDERFVNTVKLILRQSRDSSVQQIMRETLNAFEGEKAYDESLGPLITMWVKERGSRPMPQQQLAQRPPQGQMNVYNGWQGGTQPTYNSYNAARWAAQPVQGRPLNPPRTYSSSSQLPPAVELASRIEEARSSANLLMQLSASTPVAETPTNDLLQEFSGRCQTAQRSLEGYMNCTNPAPDEDTFQTLIETCEQLSLANSRYQRAVLAGRREIVNIAGNGGSTVYPAQLKAPSLGKAPSGSSIPVPSVSMRQQLQTRQDDVGPSTVRLYPSPPAAPVVNPFEEQPVPSVHLLPIELEGSRVEQNNGASPPTSNRDGYNAALARRPPIPTIIPPSLQQFQPGQPQYPMKSINPFAQAHLNHGRKSSVETDEGGLYDEPASVISEDASSKYPSPISAAAPLDPWTMQKQHWANVNASAANPAHSSEVNLHPSPTDSNRPMSAASSTISGPWRLSDSFTNSTPIVAHPNPTSNISYPPQQHLLPPSPPGGMRPTPSYHQVAVHSLTMSGGAGGTPSPPNSRGGIEEERRDAIDQERKRRSWRDFPTTRPAIPSSWGEESYVGGSGGIRDV